MTTAQDQQSRELLPCPFCGGVPETTGPWEIGVSDNYETCICCEKCGFHISSDDGFASGEKKSLAKAIDRWNRRAPVEQAARALPAGVEPVAYLSQQSAFRVSPHGQDAEAREWLEVADSPDEPGAFPVYTAAQVQAMGRVPPGWQAVPVRCPTAICCAIEREIDSQLVASGINDLMHRQDGAQVWDEALAAAPTPPPAAQKRYRLLVRNVDTIQADDEFLRDADSDWQVDPQGIFVGMTYMSNVLLPARRAIEPAP